MPNLANLVDRLRRKSNRGSHEMESSLIGPPPTPDNIEEPPTAAQGGSAFLSYAKEDERFVRLLVQDLNDRAVRVWFAPYELVGGDEIAETVSRQIAGSSFFLATVSRAANNSKWVSDERSTAISLANSGTPIRIIPIMLDDASLPPLLASRKAISMQTQNYEHGLKELLATIKGEKAPPQTPLEQFAEYLAGMVIVDEGLKEQLLYEQEWARFLIRKETRREKIEEEVSKARVKMAHWELPWRTFVLR